MRKRKAHLMLFKLLGMARGLTQPGSNEERVEFGQDLEFAVHTFIH